MCLRLKISMNKWLVIGGGVKGIFAAIILRKRGYDVCLIEAAPHLGGILYSSEWNGLFIDKGCHLLDFSNNDIANIYDSILGEEKVPVYRKYASINRGVKTDGIAVPDLSTFSKDERSRAIKELNECQVSLSNSNHSLKQGLQERYGNTIASYLYQAVKKLTTYLPEELSAEAIHSLPMERIRISSDEHMRELKKNPVLDAVLAVSSESNPLEFYPEQSDFPCRNYYPANKGMRGFCEAAKKYLEAIGVNIITNCSIKNIAIKNNMLHVDDAKQEFVSDKAYWALPPSLFCRIMNIENPWQNCSMPVSMLIVTFSVKPEHIAAYTYIHDYTTETMIFRASTPGSYGQQLNKNGDTYLCAEIAARKESDIWNSTESYIDMIWLELKQIGLIDELANYIDFVIEKLPVAYMLQGKSWQNDSAAFGPIADSFSEHIVFSGSSSYGKTDLYNSIKNDLNNTL